jgi:spermidine synthase
MLNFRTLSSKKILLIILSILILATAMIFAGIGQDKLLNNLGCYGILILYLAIFLCVLKLQSKIDLNLIKMLQVFYLAIFTIILMSDNRIDSSTLLVCLISFLIINSILFNELLESKIFYTDISKWLLLIITIFFASIIFITTKSLEKQFGWDINNKLILFFFYFITLLAYGVTKEYKISLESLTPSLKNQFIPILCAIIVIIGKIILLLGYLVHNLIFEIVYTFSAMILLLSFRGKKEYFILTSLLMVFSSFFSGKFQGMFIDQSTIAIVSILFYLKSPILFHSKSKYGDVIVFYDYKSQSKVLLNNGVVHGVELVNHSVEPKIVNYYAGKNNNGALLEILRQFQGKQADIAILGLGVGMIASLVDEKKSLTYFEIDPVVKEVAVESGLFNYIKNSPAKVEIKLGHAREELAKETKKFDIIIVDVYSGKKILSEFLTIEAFELYFEKLKPGGIVVFHMTSSLESYETLLAKLSTKLHLFSMINYKYVYDEIYSDFLNKGFSVAKEKKNNTNKFIKSIMNYLDKTILSNPWKSSKTDIVVWVVFAKDRKDLEFIMNNKKWHSLRAKSNQNYITDSDIKYVKPSIITDIIY